MAGAFFTKLRLSAELVTSGTNFRSTAAVSVQMLLSLGLARGRRFADGDRVRRGPNSAGPSYLVQSQ